MTWKMVVDPLDNIFLSALVAAVPIMIFFWALAIRRMKGHLAAITAVLAALGVAILVFRMPVVMAVMAMVNGMLFGLLPISWIVLTAVFLFNLVVKAGQFKVIQNSIASITDDRRLQALLIAFSFGAFLEGSAGLGAPVAITAAMLTGLGFNPLYAAGICLLANTAPVAFGAIGIPVIVAGRISGVDVMAVSQMVGRTLPFLSVIVPLYLVVLMSGWKRAVEVLPAIAVCGVSFAVAQWWTSNYLGPYLPDILSSILSIVALTLFLRIWHPEAIWRFPDEPPSEGREQLQYSGGQILKAWAPFIILTLFVAAWGIKSISQVLDAVGLIHLEIPGLHQRIVQDGRPLPAVFTFNYLSAAGTAILLSSLLSAWLLKIPLAQVAKTFGNTLKTLVFPILTILSVLGFAFILNFSGMSITLGRAIAATGILFPFFSPFLGWLGVFITGSDTSSNALFGKLQAVTANQIGIDPVVTVAANSSGGVTGKMISPQSLAVATAAVGLIGRESDILRFTLKHSIILATVVAVMVTLQAYVLTGWIPEYKQAAAGVRPAAAQAQELTAEGIIYLGATFALALLVILLVRLTNRK